MPRPLSFTGADLVIDSTDFLNLEALPNRVLFIGGGFVSFEFAHIAARAGANPIIVDRGARPLRGFDPDLVEMLIDRSGGIGVDLMRETEIVSVSEASRAFTVEVKSGDADQARTRAFHVLDSMCLLSLSTNLGDTKTTITHPASTTHGRISAEARAQAGIEEGLLRIAVGLESVDDLQADLARGLRLL